MLDVQGQLCLYFTGLQVQRNSAEVQQVRSCMGGDSPTPGLDLEELILRLSNAVLSYFGDHGKVWAHCACEREFNHLGQRAASSNQHPRWLPNYGVSLWSYSPEVAMSWAALWRTSHANKMKGPANGGVSELRSGSSRPFRETPASVNSSPAVSHSSLYCKCSPMLVPGS